MINFLNLVFSWIWIFNNHFLFIAEIRAKNQFKNTSAKLKLSFFLSFFFAITVSELKSSWIFLFQRWSEFITNATFFWSSSTNYSTTIKCILLVFHWSLSRCSFSPIINGTIFTHPSRVSESISTFINNT